MSTQHVLSCTSRNGFHWLVGCLLAGLSLLIPACDPFLVSVCRFENLPGCPGHAGQLADGPTDLADASPADPGAPLPLGEPRRFDLRTSVPLDRDQIKRRFVGLQGSPRQAVFLAMKGDNKWMEVYTLDLGQAQPWQRLGAATPCMESACPKIPGDMDFFRDRMYRTEEKYYFFDYKKKIVSEWPNRNELNTCYLGASSFRPFISAQYDAIGVIHNDSQLLCVKFPMKNFNNLRFASGYPTVLAIGDMDGSTSPMKDLEAIGFNENNDIVFDSSPGIVKSYFKEAITAAIEKGSSDASGAIQAAYIHDINRDNLPDLLFARSGRLRVVSYRGKKTENSLHDFSIWQNDVASPIIGETVQYVVMDNLTPDGDPDLIVETDKKVHFYRNVAM